MNDQSNAITIDNDEAGEGLAIHRNLPPTYGLCCQYIYPQFTGPKVGSRRPDSRCIPAVGTAPWARRCWQRSPRRAERHTAGPFFTRETPWGGRGIPVGQNWAPAPLDNFSNTRVGQRMSEINKLTANFRSPCVKPRAFGGRVCSREGFTYTVVHRRERVLSVRQNP